EKYPLHVSVWDTNTLLGELQLPLLPLLDSPAEPGTLTRTLARTPTLARTLTPTLTLTFTFHLNIIPNKIPNPNPNPYPNPIPNYNSNPNPNPHPNLIAVFSYQPPSPLLPLLRHLVETANRQSGQFHL